MSRIVIVIEWGTVQMLIPAVQIQCISCNLFVVVTISSSKFQQFYDFFNKMQFGWKTIFCINTAGKQNSKMYQ
jgi:hypothetical protein